jgi:hypothetical protein
MSDQDKQKKPEELETLIRQVQTPSPTGSGAQAGPDSKAELIAQKDIEDLLAEMAIESPAGSGPTAPADPKAARPTEPAKSPVIVEKKPPLTRAVVSSSASTQSLEVDRALVQKSETQRAAKPASPPAASSGEQDARLGLSKEKLDALVAKHGNVATVAIGHDKEVMLTQDDIDALVQQLSKTTGTSEQMTEILQKHGGTIDVLMQREADTARLTKQARATEATIIDSKTSSFGSILATQATGPMLAMPMMAAGEMRSTRYLLAAAVIFLALCTVMLTGMITAISGLSTALREDRLATAVPNPSDDYSADFDAALKYLQSDDEAEAAKGVNFIQKLKRKYPERQIDLSLTLARHYRAHETHGKAAQEYAEVIEHGASRGDPQVFIDYANSLMAVHDDGTALKVVYTLLANEQDYLAGGSSASMRSSEDLAKYRAVLQQAYLLLGRLLGDDGERKSAATNQVAEARP